MVLIWSGKLFQSIGAITEKARFPRVLGENPPQVLQWNPAITPGGGGTPLYGPYRYVPRNRVWFLEVLDP